MSHRITDECIGCGACMRSCPTLAISGEAKQLHSIDPKLCIDCGTCGRVCPKAAVRDDSGAVVPRLKKSEWLRPHISIEACFACENCVAACPTDALSMNDEKLPLSENYAVLSNPEACVSCRWCVDNCQFDAIRMEVIRGDI